MRDVLGISLKKLKRIRVRKKRMVALLLVLSLVVSINVFWVLRQPGLTLAGDATCGIQEHTHDDTCMTQVCICDLPEEAHEHTQSCYEIITVDPIEEKVLNCELQSEPHEHTESCFEMEVIPASTETTLTCELSETAHVHEDACYIMESNCELQEHVHRIECYADETADVETLLDWQNMFADYPFTGNIRDDLVGIARTQVGYSESERNFEIGSDGIRRGYSRYGAWYGTPYRDWSAAFVSFCLSYAGADPEKMPGNIGANAMAKQWENLGRYAPAGSYVPLAGDLVFFDDNTAGIVSQVQTATVYVIRGDIENAVCSDTVPLGDGSITGWGITGENLPGKTEAPAEETEEPVEEPTQEAVQPPASQVSAEDLLDITNGPAVYIFADGESSQKQQKYSLKNARTVNDLIEYLTSIGGTYTFSLLDTNNQEPTKDPVTGQYSITADTLYKLTLRLNSDKGFSPGTYQYQLPEGIHVNGGTGQFVLSDGTHVGDWEVTSEGLITLVFNEKMNNRTHVTISATMGVRFPAQDDPISFDGKIIVTVEPPPQVETTTKLNKWGTQGGTDDKKPDPTKLYWTMEITGRQSSMIPGSVITDQIKTGDHKYTQSDMDAGIKFGVSDANGKWHSWTVYPGDPNLTWTETGWSYTIPKTIQCWCGQVTLGNESWTYYADYTSTPTPFNTNGSFPYTNEVTIDGQYAVGWGQFAHTGTDAGIVKTGDFHGDADGGVFLWEFQAKIPARYEGAKAAYYTQIVDQLYVKDVDNITKAYIQNDANNATVTAEYNGQTINVPHVTQATAEDEFAWFVGWTEAKEGAVYTVALLPLCRCHCTEESCHYWNEAANRCDAYHYLGSSWSGFCFCWTPQEAITFTFSYQTDDPKIIEAYGGQNNDLLNLVSLQQKVYLPNGDDENVVVGEATAKVPIPGVFKKELTEDFDGYTAHYSITVNEAKLSLTDGSSLLIHDEMTETLAFISGSLVIVAEDVNGNRTTLQQGTDYTVAYDGTGTKKDENGKPVHVLDIEIKHPQPVMYILDYDATLVIPTGTIEDVKYSNSAAITLWGEKITSDSEEKVFADFNIAAMHYRVELHKKDAQTGAPLAGATFGLFNENDGLISSGVTKATENLLFETNIVQGIILQEHHLYYLQEMQAPPGYQLDDTKHWFCFCNSMEPTCETCSQILAALNGYRIPYDTIGVVAVENEIMNYDLPATGGPGIYPLILVSVVFIITPLVYGSIQRRKRERRGVG